MAVDVGDLYRLTYTNLSPGGGPVSADTMTLTITLPDGTAAAPVVVAPQSVGVYLYDYQTVQAGRHLARWVGTGTNPGAYVEVFDVRPAAPAYLISLADAKQQLNITNTTSDEELRVYLESITATVERIRNEAIVKRTFTDELYLPEYFRGIGQIANSSMPYGIDTARFRVAVSKSPAVSLTSVSRVDNTMTWTVSNLHLDPSGIIDVMYGAALVGHISVTYVAGYSIVPAEVGLAARIILQHLWETQRGSRGGSRPGGMDVTGVPGMGFAVPNRALELLGGGMPGFG
jgi:hypothetical protein